MQPCLHFTAVFKLEQECSYISITYINELGVTDKQVRHWLLKITQQSGPLTSLNLSFCSSISVTVKLVGYSRDKCQISSYMYQTICSK